MVLFLWYLILLCFVWSWRWYFFCFIVAFSFNLFCFSKYIFKTRNKAPSGSSDFGSLLWLALPIIFYYWTFILPEFSWSTWLKHTTIIVVLILTLRISNYFSSLVNLLSLIRFRQIDFTTMIWLCLFLCLCNASMFARFHCNFCINHLFPIFLGNILGISLILHLTVPSSIFFINIIEIQIFRFQSPIPLHLLICTSTTKYAGL